MNPHSNHSTQNEPIVQPVSSEQPRRKIQRTRDGCLTCRKRKIKCDLGKPDCARCVKYCVKCVYKTTPENLPTRPIRPALGTSSTIGSKQPVLQQRKKPSRRNPYPISAHKPSADSLNPYHDPTVTADSQIITTQSVTTHNPTPDPLPATVPLVSSPVRHTPSLGWPRTLDAFEPVERLMAVFRNTRMGSFFLQPTDPPDFLRSFFPSDEDLRCFHHCVTYSLSIIVVFEDHNPWTEHVAPLFMADGGQSTSGYALKLALLYLGAVHLSYLQGRDGNPTESAKTRSLALRYRKECLASIRKVSSVNLVTNIAAFLSACALTLTADLLAANTRWRELMRIVNRAIRDVGGMDVIIPSSTVVDPALKCAVEALVNLSLLSTFSSGQDYSLLSDGPQIVEGGPIWWKNLGEAEMRQPGLRRFETSCGISRSLILQFTALASYLFQIPHHGRDASIENRLKEDWLLWASSQGVLEQNKRVQAGSMAIWHAGKILILSKIRKVPVSDQTIQEAASRILDICASVGDKVEYLNWPLIIACSTFTDSNKRDIARMQLKSFEIQCCYEIEVVQMVCEEMWTRMDEGEDEEACGWVEILLESGCPVLLG